MFSRYEVFFWIRSYKEKEVPQAHVEVKNSSSKLFLYLRQAVDGQQVFVLQFLYFCVCQYDLSFA